MHPRGWLSVKMWKNLSLPDHGLQSSSSKAVSNTRPEEAKLIAQTYMVFEGKGGRETAVAVI